MTTIYILLVILIAATAFTIYQILKIEPIRIEVGSSEIEKQIEFRVAYILIQEDAGPGDRIMFMDAAELRTYRDRRVIVTKMELIDAGILSHTWLCDLPVLEKKYYEDISVSIYCKGYLIVNRMPLEFVRSDLRNMRQEGIQFEKCYIQVEGKKTIPKSIIPIGISYFIEYG